MPEQHEYTIRITQSTVAGFAWVIVRKTDGHEVARSSQTFPTRADALKDSARTAASLAFDADP